MCIASVAPLASLLLLRDEAGAGTKGYSTAAAEFSESEAEDLARYLDVTRAELVFARGVILVEGDAERFLVPAFADEIGTPLDDYGLSVCSVAGTNFEPYAKLLGALGIPFALITDYDLIGGVPRAYNRALKLVGIIDSAQGGGDPASAVAAIEALETYEESLDASERYGIFINHSTLEVELFGGDYPRITKLVAEGARIFQEALPNEDARLTFQRTVVEALWTRRDATQGLHDWLAALRADVIAPLVARTRSLGDDLENLNVFVGRLSASGDVEDMPLGEFAGIGSGLDRINLSTLHSAKGREFDVVVLFALDEGKVPRGNPSDNDLRESRRLFYVGFTRARHEVHLMYSQHNASRFVTEVQERLELA